MDRWMGVEISGQQTSLATVVSPFLDLCMLCVYVLHVSCLWDAAPLNVPPQLSLLYLTEMNGGQGWATHSSPQSQTSKKTTFNTPKETVGFI